MLSRQVLTMVKSYVDSMRLRQRTRCITIGSLLWWDLRICSTAMLSHRALMVLPAHLLPHVTAAITTGSSSLEVMCQWMVACVHCSWNQLWLWKAPQPQFPEASEVIRPSGASAFAGAKIEIPFHPVAN